MKTGSLFSGIGGFDLGFHQAGFELSWYVENNNDAKTIMGQRWPRATGYGDIRDFLANIEAVSSVECIHGGDPCPIHSRARSSHSTSSPDLAGYFLAVVGQLRPKWVVRENVRSSTVNEFAFGLELLGYGSVVIEVDAADFTRQSRKRAFVVGRYQTPRESLRRLLPGLASGPLPAREALGTRQVASCLTTHRTRYDSRDNYIFEYDPRGDEQRWRFRIPDAEEREALAGFGRHWTAGLHEAARARLLGNSVVPAIARWLASGIASYELARKPTAADLEWAVEEVDRYIKEAGTWE
jgi:DNA (cytosine-5)-methyltransferase 1